MSNQTRSTTRKIAFLRREIAAQRRWIENCEQSGVSYADGERGASIRRADVAELARLENEITRHA